MDKKKNELALQAIGNVPNVSFLRRNGDRVVVCRPFDPERAMRLAKEAVQKQDEDLLAEAGSGEFVVVGYLLDNNEIGDEKGCQVDGARLAPGDMLIEEGALKQFSKRLAHGEA